jgi:ketosteroid isomerase-like protein
LIVDHKVQISAKQAYEARFQGDIDGFCAILHEDVVMEQPWSVPYAGTFRGLAAVRRGLEQSASVWGSVSGKLERIAAGHEMIMAYVHMIISGKETGITYGYPAVELLRYKGDKVIELRPFNFDTHRIRQVFGSISPSAH